MVLAVFEDFAKGHEAGFHFAVSIASEEAITFLCPALY